MSKVEPTATGGEVEEKIASPPEVDETQLDKENKPDDYADMDRMGKKQDFKVSSPWG